MKLLKTGKLERINDRGRRRFLEVFDARNVSVGMELAVNVEMKR